MQNKIEIFRCRLSMTKNTSAQNHLDISLASLPQYDKGTVQIATSSLRASEASVAIHTKGVDCHEFDKSNSRNDANANTQNLLDISTSSKPQYDKVALIRLRHTRNDDSPISFAPKLHILSNTTPKSSKDLIIPQKINIFTQS